MPWVRIEDNFPEHSKVLGLSDAAFRLHIHALCYAARQLTDGVIPRVWLTGGKGRAVPKAVSQIVDAGLWDTDGDDYRIHDYLVYQPSRTDVEANRDRLSLIRAESGRRGGLAKVANRVANVQQTPSNPCSNLLPKQSSKPVAPSHPIPSHPQEDSKNESSETRVDHFDEFWTHYPNKVGKFAARRVWERLKPDAALRDVILTALERQKSASQWLKESGRFIPNPATWLHQGRWMDEVVNADDLVMAELHKFRPKGA
jgi:hypothetical protein